MISLFTAFFGFFIFGFYSFALLLATLFVENEVINSLTGEIYTTGDLLTVIVATITGLITSIGVIPNIQYFTKAKVVGALIF
jgi:hypothetical protein